MGLSIARSLAEAHGGRIDLVETAEGTCFALSLDVHCGTPAS
jgi:signal transduction histidine kinase